MHHSRLGGLIIDCRTDDLEGAGRFWSAALGWPVRPPAPEEDPRYVGLVPPPGEPYLEVQRVDHPSRVHLDIVTDDLESEVARLEELGAVRVARFRTWWVMEAPTGQRFCVVKVGAGGFPGPVHIWGGDPRAEASTGRAAGGARLPRLEIATATAADSSSIAALAAELGYPSDPAPISRRLEALLARPDHAVWVAASETREVVGWAHAFLSLRLETEAFTEIGGLVVGSGWRGRGVGRRLVAAAADWGSGHRCTRLRVRCRIERDGAHGFYARLGFARTKTQGVLDAKLPLTTAAED